ncbi:hypothetical protein [Kitasatospora cinereorecta]|uniref:Galactan 5-O-arabinofuranosyltransferase n=1 Tax=Kitasatospora cinereorecta TaxID=285560 RepID=A0ABW0VFD7_9ACTN
MTETLPGTPDSGSDAVRPRAVAALRASTSRRRRARLPGRPIVWEAVVGIGAALGYTLLSTHISVNPLTRIGQVSGLAKLQQYAAIIGLPVLAVLLYTAYRGPLRRHQLVQRLVCAGLAGLSTGIVAGGAVVALRGTPWPLGGHEGDPGTLTDMATSMMHGQFSLGVYPPGFPAAIAAWSEIRYGGVGGAGFALHDLQIVCTALAGPLAYLAWRLLLRPFWAVAVAAPAAVVFLDPIRPYSHTTMIVLVPLLAAALRELRRAHTLATRTAVGRAAAFGAVFGLLFLWYSGWYLWAAPGILVLALALVPWRRGRAAVGRALLFGAVTAVTAAIVGAPLLNQMLRAGGAAVPDRYAYLAVYADPAYVMGWASDRSGQLTYDTWPAPGELAGQSGFAVLLLLGVGLGIGLGLRDIAVRTAAAVLAGAWLLRFWFASHMAHDRAVQLYPRTTWIILYCLMILAVLGLMSLADRAVGARASALDAPAPAGSAAPAPGSAVRQLAAGMVCALALFTAMGASWTVNRYMPEDPSHNSMGLDAWRAQTIKKADGTCPRYAPVRNCADIVVQDWTPRPDEGALWCGGIAAADWPAVCGRKAPWTDQAPAR